MNKAMLVDILESFRSRKGRSLLSAGLIAAGFLLFTLMLGISQSLEKQSTQTLNEFGADIALIKLLSGTLPPYTEERLKLEFGTSNVSGIREHQVFVREAQATLKVSATDHFLFRLRPYLELSGRSLDAIDLKESARNCVISKAFSIQHSLTLNDPIHLRDQAFTIVGIVHAFQSSDADIYIPISCKALWSKQPHADTLIPNQFVIKSPLSNHQKITASLKNQFADNPSFQNQFSITTAEVLLRGINTLRSMVKITAGGMALLCILFGCLNLGTIMMANARERVGEIGLRRALGANTLEICALFMYEALCLCVSAALIATAIGNSLFLVIPRFLHIPMQSSLSTWSTPLLIALVAGSISAYCPVKMAAAIRPANALRL